MNCNVVESWGKWTTVAVSSQMTARVGVGVCAHEAVLDGAKVVNKRSLSPLSQKSTVEKSCVRKITSCLALWLFYK